MTKEKYIKYTKLRLIVMSMSTLTPLLIVLIMFLLDLDKKDTIFQDMLQPDMIVFTVLLVAFIEGVVIAKIVKYIRILRDTNQRDKYYIKKFDERNKYIQMRSGDLISKIFVYVISVMGVFFAFTSREYFYPVLLILLIYLAIYVIVNIVFRKKY